MLASRLSRSFIASLLTAVSLGLGCDGSAPRGPGPTPRDSGSTPVEPLVISSVSPSIGSSVGGTLLAIAGTGFAAGAAVALNGIPAQVRSVGAVALSVVTPPTSLGGAVDVVVTNPNGDSARLSGGFTYIVVGRPAIASVSASPGSTSGGAEFTILGTGFQPGARVSFGGVLAGAAFVESRLIGTTPRHGPGTVDVTVTNPDGQSDTLNRGYTYVEPGSLDFNGDWEGQGTEAETFLRFTIRNNLLTEISCGRSRNDPPTATVVPAAPVAVVDGALSFSGAEGLFIARILTQTSSQGTLRVHPCFGGLVSWSASKR